MHENPVLVVTVRNGTEYRHLYW